MLVGHIGARTVLLIGLILGSLMSVVQSFYLPISLLLVTRIVEGASHLAIVVAAPTLIAHFSSDRLRASAMMLWGTFFGVSFALTAWLGLPLVDEFGIHALFRAHALVLVTTTVLIVFVVPNRTLASSGQVLPTGSFSMIGIYKRHKQAWSSPYVAAPAAGWLFYTITFVALLAILPNLLPDDKRTSVAAAMPLASILSSMTIGVVLLWRFTAIQVVIVGFIAAIFSVMFLVVGPATVLVCVLLFAALGLVQGASFAAIPQLNATAPKQVLAYGVLAQAGNIGNLCGTPLLLFLLNSSGLTTMVWVVVVCYAAAILVHLLFSKQRSGQNSPSMQ